MMAIEQLQIGEFAMTIEIRNRSTNAVIKTVEGESLIKADLSGANLSGADLSGADLSEADLSGAYLSEADLSGANLSEANLYGADLSGIKITETPMAQIIASLKIEVIK